MIKGLSVDVYGNRDERECTNGGISSKANSLILVGKDVPEIFEGDETNLVRIQKKKEYIFAVPVNQKAGIGMFGGNFIYTSDSRFPVDYPVPLHDRVE